MSKHVSVCGLPVNAPQRPGVVIPHAVVGTLLSHRRLQTSCSVLGSGVMFHVNGGGRVQLSLGAGCSMGGHAAWWRGGQAGPLGGMRDGKEGSGASVLVF